MRRHARTRPNPGEATAIAAMLDRANAAGRVARPDSARTASLMDGARSRNLMRKDPTKKPSGWTTHRSNPTLVD